MKIRKFRIKIDGKIFEAEVEEIGEEKKDNINFNKKETPSSMPTKQIKNPLQKKGNLIVAPMPGKILKIKVEIGEKVKNGDNLLILEAMKMEQEIKASIDGTVLEILVKEGDTVRKEHVLINIG